MGYLQRISRGRYSTHQETKYGLQTSWRHDLYHAKKANLTTTEDWIRLEIGGDETGGIRACEARSRATPRQTKLRSACLIPRFDIMGGCKRSVPL
jgi:hypothetical protein